MWKSYQRLSGGACVISTTSVKDRLKNQAAANGKTIKELLTPIVDSIEADKDFSSIWDYKSHIWK